MADKLQRSDVTLDTIVSLCKRRGIIFPGSDIYGGLQGTFDYGPVGAELKRNVKNAWWRSMVQERFDIEGVDTSLLLHPAVWTASGHVENFTDPLCDSLGPSRKRYRADHIEETECAKFVLVDVTDNAAPKTLDTEIWAPTKKKAKEFFQQWYEKALGLEGRRVKIEEVEGSRTTGRFSPDDGGRLTEARQFNLMLSTTLGPVEESSAKVFLRPETAQGIFINYENARATARRKLPFGIAQQGKSFRNEITPRNFIFRTREFEQMEMEFFCKPGEFCKEGEQSDMEWFEFWRNERLQWYIRYGIQPANLRFYDHPKEKLSHYSRGTTDIEYLYPIGWQELEGIAHRGNFDLTQHMEHSGKDLRYFDPDANTHYVPYVIEPAAGVDRAMLAFLCDAYREEIVTSGEEGEGGKESRRVVLGLHKDLAPVKAAVFPLLKNRPELVETAKKIAADLKRFTNAVYDDTAAIGKLYRRQDEIGTPFCVTVDVDSMEDQAVTVRERDSMQQVRIPLDRVVAYLRDQLQG
ncbi:MAG: glycyl-tRNA synthetase [Candidatus Sumerlaeota bacterium]|nr:glycyl-tRNA synthetase [Candidatus Sumerlaeota bacterium]